METPLCKVFKVQGLSGAEWGVSFAIGIGSYPVSLLTRVISTVVGKGALSDMRHVRRRAHRRTLSGRRATGERRTSMSFRRTLSSNRIHVAELLPSGPGANKPWAPHSGAITPRGSSGLSKTPSTRMMMGSGNGSVPAPAGP